MTITPETLRTIADNATMGPGPSALNWVNAVMLALNAAADRIEQLEAPRTIMTKPYDDCECVVCETLRNPPKPTQFAIDLMRKAKAAGYIRPID